MANPLNIAKAVTELVVSIGAGAVVSNAIKISTPENSKVLTKVSIAIGGVVLSGMVGEAAAKYASTNIDRAVTEFKTAKESVVKVEPKDDDAS